MAAISSSIICETAPVPATPACSSSSCILRSKPCARSRREPSSVLKLALQKQLVMNHRGSSRAIQTVKAAVTEAPASSSPIVVDVDLGDRSYPIYIGRGLLDEVGLGAYLVHLKFNEAC